MKAHWQYVHPLLPQLPGEDYSKYDFDVRLMVELESLALNHPVTPKGQARSRRCAVWLQALIDVARMS
jgi:hypothetical protein